MSLKTNVDVLTMSATPIPRTMHMAVAGFRDTSLLTTPPPERRPIKTELSPFSRDLLRDVVQRELDRDGQVFYVVPRVKQIPQVLEELQELLPDISVMEVHGKVGAKQQERIMDAFAEGKCNVVSRNFLGNVSLFAGSTKSPEASLKLAAQCMADEVEGVASGTPVKKTSILVLGATGTLGRQVVRRALDEGYDVRCIVRPRQNPADFLRDWGAVTVRADLTKPESIPPALALIQQYAVPILEEQSVWGTDNETKTAYLDTQDVARMTLAAVGSEACVDKTLTLAGPDSYTIAEVIAKCEKLAGSEAQVTKVPVGLIKTIQGFTSFFQWTRDASDRLAFAEVNSSTVVSTLPKLIIPANTF
eukprot:gene711-1173_t